MKTLTTLISATVLATGALFAGAASADTTRAQVTAELAQARASGQVASMNSEDSARFLQAGTASAKTRAQVVAELKQSQTDGSLGLLHSEDPTDQVRVAKLVSKNAAVMAE